jgi:hypothetical protein
MASSSQGLGVVPPPLLSLLNDAFMNILLNLNEVLAMCLREHGSLVGDDVLFLTSLTTTHREAGLPTSTAQRGGLCEVGM